MPGAILPHSRSNYKSRLVSTEWHCQKKRMNLSVSQSFRLRLMKVVRTSTQEYRLIHRRAASIATCRFAIAASNCARRVASLVWV